MSAHLVPYTATESQYGHDGVVDLNRMRGKSSPIVSFVATSLTLGIWLAYIPVAVGLRPVHTIMRTLAPIKTRLATRFLHELVGQIMVRSYAFSDVPALDLDRVNLQKSDVTTSVSAGDDILVAFSPEHFIIARAVRREYYEWFTALARITLTVEPRYFLRVHDGANSDVARVTIERAAVRERIFLKGVTVGYDARWKNASSGIRNGDVGIGYVAVYFNDVPDLIVPALAWRMHYSLAFVSQLDRMAMPVEARIHGDVVMQMRSIPYAAEGRWPQQSLTRLNWARARTEGIGYTIEEDERNRPAVVEGERETADTSPVMDMELRALELAREKLRRAEEQYAKAEARVRTRSGAGALALASANTNATKMLAVTRTGSDSDLEFESDSDSE